MKKSVYAFAAIALLSMTACSEKESQYVKFADPAFKEFIVKSYVADGSPEITKEYAAEIEYIDCSGRGITDLGGIEYFVNLKTLKCQGNDIYDIDLTANTKLEYLSFSSIYEQLEDYSYRFVSIKCKPDAVILPDVDTYKSPIMDLNGVRGIVFLCSTGWCFSPGEEGITTWGYKETTTGATSDDGWENSEKIPDSPAVQWCKQFGDEYYLPVGEYGYIDTYSRNFEDLGITSFKNTAYWTSKEATAETAYTYNGSSTTWNKGWKCNVRAVRRLTENQ